jgi:dCTP deaminase
MAFWSGETLRDWIPKFGIIKNSNSDTVADSIDCAAITLRLGQEARVTPFRRRDQIFRRKKDLLRLGDSIVIPPGQFAFLLTEEEIALPNHVLGFISLRSRYKFQGLINVSGFHVDPGYEGHLLYAVYNAGPKDVFLKRGEKMFLLWLAELDQNTKFNYPDAKKRDGREFEPPLREISSARVNSVTGGVYSPQALAERMQNFETTFKVLAWVLVAIISMTTLGVNIIANWDRIKAQF